MIARPDPSRSVTSRRRLRSHGRGSRLRCIMRDFDGGNNVAGAAASGDAYLVVVVVPGFVVGDRNIAHRVTDARPSAYLDSVPIGRVGRDVALRSIFSDGVVRIIVAARTSRNRATEPFAVIVRITREVSSPRR